MKKTNQETVKEEYRPDPTPTWEEDSFTLESILAEYKSDAFMAGDRKTPSDVLQKRTERILKEAHGEIVPDADEKPAPAPPKPSVGAEPDIQRKPQEQPEPSAPEEYEPTARQLRKLEKERRKAEKRRQREIIEEEPLPPQDTRGAPSGWERNSEYASARSARNGAFPQSPPAQTEIPLQGNPSRVNGGGEPPEPERRPAQRRGAESFPPRQTARRKTAEPDEEHQRETANYEKSVTDTDPGYFENLRYSDRTVNITPEPDEEDDEYEYEDEDTPSFFSRLFQKRDTGEESFVPFDDYAEEEEDPDIKSEISHFGKMVPSLRMRTFGASVVCVVMAVVMLITTLGGSLPFGIGKDPVKVTAAMLILELVTMALGMNELITGLEDIIQLSPGTESLVFISCLVSVADGFAILVGGSAESSISLAVVSAWSLLFTISSRKNYCKAMCDSLKTSIAVKTPFGIVSDGKSIEGRNVLKKVTGAYKGFYGRITEADYGEILYGRFAPLFLVLSVLLSILLTFPRGRGVYFLHTLSIMTAITAAFPASSVFTLPFQYVAARGKKVGSAIAGWGGACDIFYADSAVMSDLDLFPVGTVSLSGFKLFEGVQQQKVVTYTSSIVIASGSGLSKLFTELLASQEMTTLSVQELTSNDGGGLSAIVNGERVMVGTGAFMNLMGIRIPEDLNTTRNLYTAINGELAGAFTINYIPIPAVQSALVSLLNTRIRLLLAVRDVNITPKMIQQKYKVSMESVEYLPMETVYKLSENTVDESCGAAAILCRGGLAPLAEVVTRGRQLKTVTELNTLLSLIMSGVGLILMFFICWAGAYTTASSFNIFLYMALNEIAVRLISHSVNRK